LTYAPALFAVVLDTETTGFDEPAVIELASAPVTAIPGPRFTMGEATVHRFKPPKQIQLGAMATHHILPADLEDCPPTPEKFELPRYIIGHHVDYDWQALGSPAEVKRVDTCVLARAAWPELDSHSLGALTYHLHPHAEARDLLKNAHSAATDVALCFRVFEAALLTIPMDKPIGSWGDVWKLSEWARVPKLMTFGKHEGKPIAEVPRDYAEWYERQDDTDPYVIIAFQKAGLLP
jgi:exodeoxyribonuclease X